MKKHYFLILIPIILSACVIKTIAPTPSPTTTTLILSPTTSMPSTTLAPLPTTTISKPTTTIPQPTTTTWAPVVPNHCTQVDSLLETPLPVLKGQVRYNTGGSSFGSGSVFNIDFKSQIISFKITIPNPMQSSYSGVTFNPNHLGFMRIAEVPGGQVTARDITVSKNPCDFYSGQYLYNGIGFGDTAPGANFTINNPNYQSVGANFNLSSGDTVYLSVRNWNNTTPTCQDDWNCNILFDFASPTRY